MSAGGAVTRVVEEHDADVAFVVDRLGHEAAVHVGVAARLVDEQPSNVIEVLRRVPALVEDGPSHQRYDSTAHDAEGFARGVVVGGGYPYCPGQPDLPPPQPRHS